MNKKAQVTIFIILALILIVSIALIYVIIRKPEISLSPEENPEAYIEKCARDVVAESVEKIFKGGGRIDPELFIMHQGGKYNYLCYNKNYYLTCINHHPMLKNIVEEEIEKDTINQIKRCFFSLKEDLEKKKYSVLLGELDYQINLAPQKVLIEINRKLDFSKEGNVKEIKKFNSRIISPLYELIMVAREIVNQESQFCNFEYNGFMLLYPKYDLKRIEYDESRLYRIIDRVTSKEFKFAVRSCAFPPGL